jgi:Tol biopolymer transport system component
VKTKVWIGTRSFAARVSATMITAAIVVGGNTGAVAATGPNGLIAYSSWDDDLNYDISVVDPANPDIPPVRLTADGRYNADPDWSPDGTKIVYDGWADAGGRGSRSWTPTRPPTTGPC